ncbi:MAG: hypothetical protein ACKOEP_00150, partial [Phycisphaerales bacterium]
MPLAFVAAAAMFASALVTGHVLAWLRGPGIATPIVIAMVMVIAAVVGTIRSMHGRRTTVRCWTTCVAALAGTTLVL